MTRLINTQNTGNEEKSSRTRTFGRQKGRSGHPFRDKGEVTRHTTHGFENDQHPSSVWSQLSVPDYRIGVWTGQEHNKSIRETAHALSLTQEVSVAKALSCTAVNSTKTGAMSYKMDEKVINEHLQIALNDVPTTLVSELAILCGWSRNANEITAPKNYENPNAGFFFKM